MTRSRAAWRVVVGIVPQEDEQALLEVLGQQLGRGDVDVKMSLARVLVDLSLHCDGVLDLLAERSRMSNVDVAVHARACASLVRDPGANFAALPNEAEPRPDARPYVSGRDESESVPALVGAILRATAPLESESAAR